LQQRAAQLENALTGHALEPTPATPGTATSLGPSRAERRRLEREQQRRRTR
jgi:hypothetical protein